MAIPIQNIRLIVALALSPRAALAGECPAGAAPFPSDMANSGRQQYANLFDISYYDTYKVIHYSDTLSTYKSSHPAKAGERIPDIVLWQCNTTKPSYGSEGIDDASARYFEIPIQKATLPWGGPLPQFELLSVTEYIYAMDFTYVSSACAQLMEQCVPSLHVTSSDENYSTIAAVEPGSVVFTDSFGTGYTNTSWDVEYQSSVDPAILNRAEWTNFVAAFFNLESESNEIFSQIEADYSAMKTLGSQLALDSDTEWGGRQPQVIWVNAVGDTTCSGADDCVDDNGDAIIGWTQVDGSWCKCGGWQINTAHYKKNLVEDAGGTLVALPQTAPDGCVTATNTDGSTTLGCGDSGLTSFKAFLAEADVIVDETYIWGYDTASFNFSLSYSVTADEVPALARDPVNIYRADGTVSDNTPFGSVGSAWFDWAQAEPQQLLAGMMEMLWGDNFESACGLKYFRRAVPSQGQEQVGHEDCPYYDADGSHDCAAIHDHLHEVLSCMPTPAPPAPTPSPYPVAYTNCGVSNTLSAAPTKVITMNQGATEFLLAMGLEGSMVGTAYLDDAIWPKYATAYASIPVLSSGYPDEDTIMDKDPDFIVASYNSAFRALYTRSDGSVRGVFNMSCTGPGSDYGEIYTGCRPQLNEMGIGTYIFEDHCENTSLRPDTVTEETIYEELRTLGSIFGVDPEPIIDDMKEDFDSAAALVSSSMDSDPLKTVWLDCVGRCCDADDEVFVGGGTGAPNLLMVEAGLTNVFSDESGGWVCVKISAIVAADPDVIVVVDAAWDSAADKIQWLYNDEDFCQLDVLKAARFVSIPFSATTLSPRNGPAAYDLAIAAIHVRTGAVTPAQESGVTSFNPYFIQAESECGKCPMSISDVVYTEASDDDTVTVECPDEETASKSARAGTAALYASLAASAVALSQVSCA